MEFENIKEALETLVSANDREGSLKVNGKPGNLNDLKEFNFEALVWICDSLGMEDIYLKNASQSS
ncbi:hypothetical protein H5991_08265 [Ligilactobacillus agilis]|uniref:hypothetical protein n=1 Tax=Ligilactobacillus agilis TaxID=1601 RepID=UPI00195A6D34|nr:hypothetical protein [Ligilactobacillus agilis]MBM6773474.1 hypothetical protein [Ligilactobacillus agilis]